MNNTDFFKEIKSDFVTLEKMQGVGVANYVDLIYKIYHLLQVSISALNEMEDNSQHTGGVSFVDISQTLQIAVNMLPKDEAFVLDNLYAKIKGFNK